MKQRITIGLALAMVSAALVAAPAAANSPTCAEEMGITVHAQHIVGDYVIGGGLATWPPAGQVGSAIKGVGANPDTRPGGPGPGFHFIFGFAPGASFCIGQSQSPGFHFP